MLTFEEMVQGYARDGNAEALRHLRTFWSNAVKPDSDRDPVVEDALLRLCFDRVALIDDTLRRMA